MVHCHEDQGGQPSGKDVDAIGILRQRRRAGRGQSWQHSACYGIEHRNRTEVVLPGSGVRLGFADQAHGRPEQVTVIIIACPGSTLPR